ncbi:MAG: glycosyltransferase family 4 protein [Flavobacteriaceae bacterium]|nr:glycosyltransferase family 4 protein [Flavobacteriaceae bacterium]
MKKKILYLALDFPNIEKSNNLYTDLMEEFRDNDHEVYVVAPSSDIEKTVLTEESGLNVLRVKSMPLLNVNIIKKGIANMLLPKVYLKAIKKHYQHIDFDLIILPTPPITLYKVVNALKKKSKTPVYLILRDIFPQNAVDLGMISKKGAIYKYFRRMEKKLYAISDSIGCMSQGNIDYVINHNKEIDSSKLHLLRNWQKKQEFNVIDKNEVKKKFALDGKFVIFFGGNIGKPQKVENIVALAESFKENEKVVFYIIGKGTEKDKLITLVKENHLNNVIIKDFLPRNEYIEMMQIADVGLVSLDENFTIPNMPSKALSYFNVNIPVVALLDENTDFGTWIEDEVKAGFWVSAKNPSLLKDKIELLIEDPEQCRIIGENGYNYFNANLNPSVAYKTIINSI